MANTFKNAIKSNVSNGSYDSLYTAPSSSGNTAIILGLALANKTTSAKQHSQKQHPQKQNHKTTLETTTCVQHNQDTRTYKSQKTQDIFLI